MKKLILLASLLAALCAEAAPAAPRVLMMVADDFMWPEYAEPRKAYEDSGFHVFVAGKFKEEVRPDRRNLVEYPDAKAVKVDLSFDEVKVDAYDAITFVGRNGAWHDFFPTQRVHEIVLESFEKKKLLALLCTSTGLLGLTGNFDGKHPVAAGRKAVGYFRVEGIIQNLGKVNLIPGGKKEPGVQVDDNLITGRNPESSKLFGETVVATLKKKIKKESL